MYDFETIIDRSKMGSEKWLEMKRIKPDVPADVIPFSVADMELLVAPEITAGMRSALDATVLGYTSPTEEYLKTVCHWMKKRHDWDIEPEWISVCAGVVPALFQAVNAFTEPGDSVLMFSPVYGPFYSAAEKNGRKVVCSPLHNVDCKFEIDFNDFERKASENQNSLFLFCNPHNPIGRVWRYDELERIAQICIKYGLTVVSDDIHFDLIMPEYKHTVLSNVSSELADRIIVCTSPSKTFNIAGLHAANIVIQNEDLRRRFKNMIAKTGFSCVNICGYMACSLAYTKAETWLDALLLKIAENRDLVETFMLQHIPAIKVARLEGTYLQWWDCRGLGMQPDSLERFLTHEALLFTSIGTMFGKEGAGFARVNLACPTSVLQDALYRLKKAVDARADEEKAKVD